MYDLSPFQVKVAASIAALPSPPAPKDLLLIGKAIEATTPAVAVSDVTAAAATAVGNISGAATGALSDVATAKTSATNAVGTARSGALTDIETARQQAVQSVQSAGNGANAASGITFAPYGSLNATNVQNAIQQLDDKKLGKQVGTSVNDPGTGKLEYLLPVTTVTAASLNFAAGHLYTEVRRANGGAAMADVLPPSGTAGLANGTTITINNADATANLTLSPGSGIPITISGNTVASVVIGPGRSTRWVYDAAGPTWRPTLNTLSALLAANALGEIAAAGAAAKTSARANIGAVIGADVQAWDADLDAIAALTTTAFGRSFLDRPDAAAALTLIGALARSGGTMTGLLTLSGDPSAAMHAATKQYVDALKSYVDSSLQGLKPKPSARYATTPTSLLPAYTTSGNVLTASANGALVIDGSDTLGAIGATDYILNKDDASGAYRGLYVVTQQGTASLPWVLTRAPEADAWSEIVSAIVLVDQGTVNADVAWNCTADRGGTLNTTAMTWVKFGTLAGLAPLLSPAFTGIPTGPTAAQGTNTTQLATMAALLNEFAARKGTGALLRALADDTSFLTAKALADGMAFTSPAWAASFAPNWSVNGFNQSITANGNTTLTGPFTGGTDGEPVIIEYLQDATGSRTLAFNTTYFKIPPALTITASTAANARDQLYGKLRNRSGTIVCEVSGFDKAVP